MDLRCHLYRFTWNDAHSMAEWVVFQLVACARHLVPLIWSSDEHAIKLSSPDRTVLSASFLKLQNLQK
jgi:hypothetical protein